jgi:transcriptional regulator with XRE-family HTH domain
MTQQEIFGERVRRRRMALGLNQKQLAERLGWRAATVGRYEKGTHHTSITFARLRALAQVLSTSTDYLLGLTSDPGPVPEKRRPGKASRLASHPPSLYAHALKEDMDSAEYTTEPDLFRCPFE